MLEFPTIIKDESGKSLQFKDHLEEKITNYETRNGKLIFHPKYKKHITSNYDIAIGYIIDDLPEFYRPFQINSDYNLKAKDEIFTAGFGMTHSFDRAILSEFKGYQGIVGDYYRTPNANGLIVVKNDQASNCPGDSGGPLYIKESGTFKLAGISHANFGESICEENNFAIFNDASLYLDWLESASIKLRGLEERVCIFEDLNNHNTRDI